MIIKSLSGKTIYTASCRTMRGALEEGVAKGIDFSFADLRKAQLRDACLDGIVAAGASLWAADLSGADIGLGDLRKSDMRCALLKDTCLAETDLSGADLSGAYFSGTIVEGAVLDRVRTSCPSFWDVDSASARSMRGLVYSHKGECDLAVSPDVRIVRTAGERIILNDGWCLWRGGLYGPEGTARPLALEKRLLSLSAEIGGFLAGPHSHHAKQPIPKSSKKETRL